MDDVVTAKVTADPISSADCEKLPAPSDGALVIFAGVVRADGDLMEVVALDYEAYGALAEKQMVEIGRRALEEFGLGSVYLVHRTGELAVGEVSVVAAVTAPHRDEAFRGCRFCIDELKAKAAVWKKEVFAAGGSRWAGNG